ncbi:MAG: hypothetical protein COB62_05525 [Piscirickettsiaceae bacterium]|nr:MAG: hypothetical protein COB62_05525 [Piscirickettsiaceae bacterium]
MLDMVKNSVILFWQGRLFQDLGHVIKQASIGIVVAAVLVVVLAKMGLALWLCVVIGSLVSGGVQPYLFKDLKYA